MRSATLIRPCVGVGDSDGTFGIYRSDKGFSCVILERSSSGDHPCIPEGTYSVKWTEGVHPRHPKGYEVTGVPGRTAILIHSANIVQQIQGCLAPGSDVVTFPSGAMLGKIALDAPQRGVSSSGPTLALLLDDMQDEFGNQQDFSLTISRATK